MESPENQKVLHTDKRTFSNREWWLVIIVIVIGEYLFLDKVFKYGANEGIVSYVSFAGTIVSIILAVLAIVYSYYQNFSQQRDSSNIATQIDLLRKTVVDVRVSKTEFTSELKRINEISDKLDQSLSILEESKAHVTQLSSEFITFRSLFETSTTSHPERGDWVEFSRPQIRYLLEKQSDVTKANLYALYKSAEDDIGIEEGFAKYAMGLFDEAFKAKEGIYSLAGGTFITTLTIFDSLGLISRSKNKFIFNSDLEELIKELVETGMIIESTDIKESIKKLKENS